MDKLMPQTKMLTGEKIFKTCKYHRFENSRLLSLLGFTFYRTVCKNTIVARMRVIEWEAVDLTPDICQFCKFFEAEK